MSNIYITVLISILGLIFTFLKYILDQNTYHKSLFDERYKIFLQIDEILSLCFQEKDKNGDIINWHFLVKKLDDIYRKSYFIFSKKTYKFINEFRKAVIDFKTSEKQDDSKNNAGVFLSDLLNGQNLSQKFPELKIDLYYRILNR
jgi:hypothetical protein